MQYLLGIDIGTSGTKTVLFDTEGRTITSALSEYPLYQPVSAGQNRILQTGGMPLWKPFPR